jgi:dipeptidyl aminopeptidase/acylaminoacyl peptidase
LSGGVIGAAVVLFAVSVQARTIDPGPPQTSPAQHQGDIDPDGVPPLKAFFAQPIFSNAKLAPDGNSLAIVQTTDHPAILLRNLETHELTPILDLPGSGLSITWLQWKGNNRLLAGVQLLDVKRNGELRTVRYGQFVVAVDRDGKNYLQLLKGDFWKRRRGVEVSLVDPLKNDPDHVLLAAPDSFGNEAALKVNIRTGDAATVEKGASDVSGWLTDSAGEITVRFRVDYGTGYIEARPQAGAPWSKVAVLHEKDLKALDELSFMGPAQKPGQFYVTAKPKTAQEGDQRRLRIYDLATKSMSDPVWPELKYDIDDIVYDGDTAKLAGVCYTADVQVCDLSDPAVQAHLKGLGKYFGGDRSVMPISYSNDGQWWVLSVSGPDQPAAYYLYDKAHAKIEMLADRYPDLPSDQLAVRERFAYPARDGVSIPGYLTRPRQAKKGPLPLIVLPHGGPESRDSFEYDVWSQFLASRGYLVLQPNFRGSSGYGVSFAESGYRHWDKVMADDLTDGVQALVKSGQADPNRICIFGASYGGYAALYAGASRPELYKCVVSWAGIADLDKFLHFERDFHGKDSGVYEYWLKQLGDPQRDAAAIKAASPITYAARYAPPVLLIHGVDDDIVDPEQSKLMQAALKKAGKDVRLLLYAGEGHGGWESEDEEGALIETFRFIQSHIGPAATGGTVASR